VPSRLSLISTNESTRSFGMPRDSVLLTFDYYI